MAGLRNNKYARMAGMLLADVAFTLAALYLALCLRYEMAWNIEFTNTFSRLLPILAVYAAALVLGGTYDVLWRYAGVNEVIRLTVTCLAASAVTILLNYIFRWSVSRPVLCLTALLTVIFIGGSRMAWRMLTTKRRNDRAVVTVKSPRVMIVGAGIAGSYVMSMCKLDPGLGTPVVLVDDDTQKQRLRIQGVAVRGRVKDIPQLVAKYDVDDIIIAIPSLKGEALNRVVEICQQTACRVRISSQIKSADDVIKPDNMFVRELNISDFLSRDEVQLNLDGILDYLSGRVVMVTGGGGSIGSELCRQIMRFSPKLLIVFDIYENCAYELECELKLKYGADCPLIVLIGSVRDKQRLAEVFGEYKPAVVFHAAAHKHVPLMEDSPAEAVKNNVFGTMNVLEAASACGADRFVLLSTDKAVNPTNVMGATKRITEMLIQYYAKHTEMKCMAVRFGNVLGSHGSVIPLFEKQIKSGGPVTVTHPDIIRYFMTIPEAAQLVLQAGSSAISGSIFVLDMGEPVRIDDLAKKLIRFYGYEPGTSMAIVYTGLRPGEKLYEELLMDVERDRMQRTAHDRIMVAPAITQDDDQFEMQLQTLAVAAEHNDARVIDVIHVIVPTFQPPQEQQNAPDMAAS